MEPTTKPTDGVRVELGGREFTLRYPLWVLKEAKQRYGGSITSGETLAKIDIEDMSEFLLFGLKVHHPEVTVEELDRLYDPTQHEYIMRQYAKAIGRSLPEPKNDPSPTEVIQQLSDLLTRAEAIKTEVTEAMKTGSPSGPSRELTLVSATASSGA
jgi:hypothetical protein